MGKEWYWSKSNRKGSSSNGGSVPADTREKNTTQVMGCMSSIFHLFDLHQLLFTTRPAGGTQSPSSSATEFVEGNNTPRRKPTKGVEAPRNSLELDVTPTAIKFFTSSPIKPDDQDDYEIPFSIQIVPKRKATLEEQIEEERNSQAMSSARSVSKGNVVAKLMGLETLPFSSTFTPRTRSFDEQAFLSPPAVSIKKKNQYNRRKKNRGQEQQEMGFMGRRVASSQSPSPRCPLQPKNCNSMVDDDVRRGTRSLPETPRASFARRSWDSDPRLSLQSNATTTNCYCNNNKENMINGRGNLSDLAMQELKCVFQDYSSVSSASPVTAKAKVRSQANVGDEQRSSPSNYAREIVRQMKDSVSRRIERGRSTRASSESPTTTPRSTVAITKQSSPRSIRVVEVAEQKQVSTPRAKSTPKTKQSQLASSSPLQSPPQKCRKVSCERFNERLKKPPANVGTTATCVISSSNSTAYARPRPPRRSRKNATPPPPIPIDVKREKVQPSSPPELRKPPPVPEEFEYVKIVLERAGIRSHTSLPFAVRWNSPSHPLDPIIFHQLELTSIATDSGPLRHRCNRKLLFDLVDEILANILYPYLVENPRCRRSLKATIPTGRNINGDSLLNRVWLKIRSYPQAKCEVIQDIDALVESDLPDQNIRQLLKHPAVEDESENITVEIQRSIIDHLVKTTTVMT